MKTPVAKMGRARRESRLRSQNAWLRVQACEDPDRRAELAERAFRLEADYRAACEEHIDVRRQA